jgi:hypothetical protein
MWRVSHTRHVREFHRATERFPALSNLHPDSATAAAIWVELRRALWHRIKTRKEKILNFFFYRKEGTNVTETVSGVKAQNGDTKKQRPVHEIRYGALRATIWQHESDKGPWFNATFSRSYLDDDGLWQTANAYGRRDLLEVAKLASEAHSWIHRELAKIREQNGQEGAPSSSEDSSF